MRIRRQLSLFLPAPERATMDSLRQQLDPIQHALIPAHVTLCRDDELPERDGPGWRLRCAAASPIHLKFGRPCVFQGHGVLLPCVAGADSFHALRQMVLGKVDIRVAEAHITLAHPRNPRAEGNQPGHLPPLENLSIRFTQAYWIEQEHGSPWRVVERFSLGHD